MSSTLIATVNKSSVHALAFQGIMVYTQFSQLSDMIRRKFGDEYVLLFAKPVENTLNGEIDWYTPVQGEAQKFEDAPENLQAAASEKIREIARNIQSYADELIHSPDNQKVTRGKILELALSYPDNNAIYLVGEQPVIICWGFGPGTPGVEPENLTRIGAKKIIPKAKPEPATEPPVEHAPVAPRPVPAAAAPFSWAWLWWLLPLLAAALLFFLLFTSFGSHPALSGVTLFNGPQLPFLSEKRDHTSEINQLKNEIASLKLKADEHVAMCKPPAAEKPAAPNMAPAAPEQADLGEQLQIPDQAVDTSFLEGEWLCDTGLANNRTGEPVKVIFSFNRMGTGTGRTIEQNDECMGNARSEITGGKLVIMLDAQQCRKRDASYSPVSITCESATNHTTICHGANADGSTWDADFRKIK